MSIKAINFFRPEDLKKWLVLNRQKKFTSILKNGAYNLQKVATSESLNDN